MKKLTIILTLLLMASTGVWGDVQPLMKPVTPSVKPDIMRLQSPILLTQEVSGEIQKEQNDQGDTVYTFDFEHIRLYDLMKQLSHVSQVPILIDERGLLLSVGMGFAITVQQKTLEDIMAIVTGLKNLAYEKRDSFIQVGLPDRMDFSSLEEYLRQKSLEAFQMHMRYYPESDNFKNALFEGIKILYAQKKYKHVIEQSLPLLEDEGLETFVYADVQLLKLRSLIGLKAYDQAQNLAEEMITKNDLTQLKGRKYYWQLQLILGDINYKQKKFDRAQQIYEQLMMHYFQGEIYEEGRYQMGRIYFDQGLMKKAREWFEEFLVVYPQSRFRHEALLKITQCYFLTGQFLRAARVSGWALREKVLPAFVRLEQLLLGAQSYHKCHLYYRRDILVDEAQGMSPNLEQREILNSFI